MFTIPCYDIDGNPVTRLVQWDKNQKIVIPDLGLQNVPYFHFCNRKSTEAIVVSSVRNGDNFVAEIPNILLQQPYPVLIYVYAYLTATSAKTVYTIKIPVTQRVKPSDYTDSNSAYHYVAINNSNYINNPVKTKKITAIEEGEVLGSKKKLIHNVSFIAFMEDLSDFFTSFDGIEFSKWIFKEDAQTKNGLEFKIFDTFTITFTRSGNNLDFAIKYQETTLRSNQNYTFTDITAGSFDCYCCISTNNKVISIRLFDRATGKIMTHDMLFILTDNSKCILGFGTGSNNYSAVMQNLLDTGQHAYTIPARCEYFNNENDYIEVIMNKAICEGTLRTDTISDLCDCSKVSADTIYMLDNKKYYAIDNYTLMPI